MPGFDDLIPNATQIRKEAALGGRKGRRIRPPGRRSREARGMLIEFWLGLC